ncbi:MAG: putative toxin-antitoxin system toxin component, PIN family [Nanoarchaeota archaeon]|nr:putative toxin-antitoxin system toxin component, PIN family [Nanoarchaeota archaeon]
MIRLVLDTNTLISALGWKDSNPRKILDRCLAGKYVLIESLELLKEFLIVIQRPKFDFIPEEDKKEFLTCLMNICELVEPEEKLDVIEDDPADNIVLECALAGKADYIITGDEHLLRLKEFKGMKIVSRRSF